MGILEDAALTAGETKVERFNRLLPDFGNSIINDSLCAGFKIVVNDNDLNTIIFDGKALKAGGKLQEVHREIGRRYLEFMHSCGITDEDFEKSSGSISWEI